MPHPYSNSTTLHQKLLHLKPEGPLDGLVYWSLWALRPKRLLTSIKKSCFLAAVCGAGRHPMRPHLLQGLPPLLPQGQPHVSPGQKAAQWDGPSAIKPRPQKVNRVSIYVRTHFFAFLAFCPCSDPKASNAWILIDLLSLDCTNAAQCQPNLTPIQN